METLLKISIDRHKWKNFVASPLARGRNGQIFNMYVTDANRTDNGLENLIIRVVTTTISSHVTKHHISIWKYLPAVLGAIFFAFGIVTLTVFFVKKCGSASFRGCLNGTSSFPDKPIKYSEIGNTHSASYSEKSCFADKKLQIQSYI